MIPGNPIMQIDSIHPGNSTDPAEPSAVVFNIQKFCLHDGPGIRTAVFLKGCPLHCVWCHNPESHRAEPEILYDPSKCSRCGACAAACPNRAHAVSGDAHVFHRDRCVQCGRCAETCLQGALEQSGRRMTVSEVLDAVLVDRPFYRYSGGGLTLSGGEPLASFDFSLELFRRARREGLKTCLETCGFCATEQIRQIAAWTDRFLYDWKVSDAALHREYTGADNRLVEQNLRTLDALGSEIVLRCPIIPTVNDTEPHFERIAALANSLDHVVGVDLEPYHDLGGAKYEKLGRTPPQTFPTPSQEAVREWVVRLQALTRVPVRKG